MKIRRAELKDAEVVAKINVETWQSAYRGLIDDAILDARQVDEKRIASWAKNIGDPNFIVLVCEDEDKDVIGYLSAGRARDDWGIKHEIYAFYVHPTAQGRGAGTALMKEYKQAIKNESFYLYMLKDNKKAAGFYEKNGGVVAEKFKHYLTIHGQTLEERCYVFK